MSYDNIPQDLKSLRQWVAFKIVERDNGKAGKLPINPHDGTTGAKANDPTTWGTYDDAITAKELYDLDGIGFEFANGIFGVDLDDVIKDGHLTKEAQDVVDTLDSYTEYSPSGTGLHILCRGSIPSEDNRKGFIEMYNTGRFFTVTGQLHDGRGQLRERTQEALKVHTKYLKRTPVKTSQERPGEPTEVTVDDSELLQRAYDSAKGAEIRALYCGDMTSHDNDHSAADQALINHLVYWTNGDAARVDRLFRSSGLMRSKWDERRGAKTYGQLTIDRGLKGFTPYTKVTSFTKITSGDRVLYDANAPKEAPTVTETKDQGFKSALAYLQKDFKNDRATYAGYTERKTGFDNLDDKTGGLYPGLYVVGAQSSLGKTTFVHQLGDQLAKAGDVVLFFSLEQSSFELVTKSLARESFKADPGDNTKAKSAIEIRAGAKGDLLNRAYTNYKVYANNMLLKECNFNENIESIEKSVADFIKETGKKPVVIIDYLQIIPALDPRMTDKEKVDQNVKRLKILQRNNDLVLFVISAINRANYMQPISFESFKESGGIEYTADVIWGMQYSCLREALFDTDKKVAEKRRRIQEAKTATPRQIELVCLKNRYGLDYSAWFTYYPKFDYFKPDKIAANMYGSKATVTTTTKERI